MTEIEKNETEKVANDLVDVITNLTKLSKEQTKYLKLIFDKLQVDIDLYNFLNKDNK